MSHANDEHEITPGGTRKTAKLTQIEKQADSGRRLVEYFLIVSSVEREAEGAEVNPDKDNGKPNNPNDLSFSWKTESTSYDEEDEFAGSYFRPDITARYPLHDHQDNPLHENVTFFCHPSGGIQLRTEQIMPKVRKNLWSKMTILS
jgi:hypothetical protein